MEINPFKTTISFKQYLEVVKPKTVDVISNYSTTYHQIIEPPIITYYESKSYIIGYHNNKINNEVICLLVNTNNNNGDYKMIFADANAINVTIEVVLKEELKDIKTVEQTKLFDNEQGKD